MRTLPGQFAWARPGKGLALASRTEGIIKSGSINRFFSTKAERGVRSCGLGRFSAVERPENPKLRAIHPRGIFAWNEFLLAVNFTSTTSTLPVFLQKSLSFGELDTAQVAAVATSP